MPNILALSLEGFSFSSRGLYEQLLPKVLTRAILHESSTAQDALNYIASGWPTIILVTDTFIVSDGDENQKLLASITKFTRNGGTTILMGFFAPTAQVTALSAFFKNHFDLRWRVSNITTHETRLLPIDNTMLRTTSLVPAFSAKALFLTHVPTTDIVYAGGATHKAYAALGRVELGKLGYIGYVNFGEEPERLILAMCCLDRAEDAIQRGAI